MVLVSADGIAVNVGDGVDAREDASCANNTEDRGTFKAKRTAVIVSSLKQAQQNPEGDTLVTYLEPRDQAERSHQ